VRAPTLVNMQAVSTMMKGGYLADMPITLAAIDPCFSCTDRMIELRDESGNASGEYSWPALRQLGIRHYQASGIDFTELSKKLASRRGRV
jgi:NADH-quinone oxidoreductase subunit D